MTANPPDDLGVYNCILRFYIVYLGQDRFRFNPLEEAVGRAAKGLVAAKLLYNAAVAVILVLA